MKDAKIKLNQFMSKMTNALICSVVIFGAMSSQALQEGTNSGGGGDVACENRIQLIRDDLKKWIHAGGSGGLNLLERGTYQKYNSSMLLAIESTSINCVGEGDYGFPVNFRGTPKTCVAMPEGNLNTMTCDFKKVASYSEEELYRQVHHEYATLAGFEKPNGGISDYEISNQISTFLTEQVVKKLAIQPNLSEWTTHVAITGAVFAFESFVPGLGPAYRDPSGLKWAIRVGGKNFQSDSESECKSRNVRLPTIEEAEKLLEYLGYQSVKGYSPNTLDRRFQVLPGLAGGLFWTSSTFQNKAWGYEGLFGGTVLVDIKDTYNMMHTRCVSK